MATIRYCADGRFFKTYDAAVVYAESIGCVVESTETLKVKAGTIKLIHLKGVDPTPEESAIENKKWEEFYKTLEADEQSSVCKCISRIGVTGEQHGKWTCRSCGKEVIHK